MYDGILQLISSGNWHATLFGLAVFGLINFIGWLQRRPLARQAVKTEQDKAENDRFSAQVNGFQNIIKSLTERIVYLESQQRIAMEYEDTLLKHNRELAQQLRECRESQILGGRRAGDPSC